jgi:hypothetical protein
VKKFVLAPLLWFSMSFPLLAQGSLYSIYGVGELSHIASSQAAAMGSGGIGTLSPFYINHANPATLSAIGSTRISGDVLYSGYLASGNLGSTYQTLMNFSGAGVALPIWKTVFAAGLYPYSRLNYNQRQTGSLDVAEFGETNFTYVYRGLGGLNRIPLSVGFTTFNDKFRGTLRLGFSLNFIFGSFRRERENTFDDVRLSSSSAVIEERASGSALTFGGAYSKRNLFSRNDELTVGATITTATNLSGSREEILLNDDIDDTLSIGDGQIALPSSFGIGLAYHSGGRYALALDLLVQNWSSFTYFTDDVSFARNTLRLGFGGEYDGISDRRASLLARTTLRAGVYFNQTYLQFQDVGGINELGFTAGVSIPITNDFSRLDVNFDYAMRGKTSVSFVNENVFRVRFALNAGELWFQKRKIE